MADLKLDFLGVTVTNFKKSLEFYTEVMGIKVAAMYPEWGNWAGLGRTWDEHHHGKLRGLMMELFEARMAALRNRTWGHGQGVRPSIQVKDLARTVTRLRSRGVRFTSDIEQTSWAKRIEFIAPENIRWTLAYSPDYPYASSLRDPYIGWVELKVKDVEASKAFYGDVMRMKLAKPQNSQVVFKQGPGEALLFLEPGGKQSPTDPDWPKYVGWGQPVLISFMTSNIKRAAAWLKKQNVTIIEEVKHHPEWGGTDINIIDPDGNRIQVVQYE
jgi:predicted enzyme related to lactoylglutathione lyase